jgi:hypothetical protein
MSTVPMTFILERVSLLPLQLHTNSLDWSTHKAQMTSFYCYLLYYIIVRENPPSYSSGVIE